jgi:acyl-coenzyme A thioesterase PaaI-like protein
MNAPASHASPAFQQLERLVLSMPMAQTLGLKFTRIAPGEVDLETSCRRPSPFGPASCRPRLLCHWRLRRRGRCWHDTAPGWVNATVDATLKLIAPAKGVALRARGRVIDAGKLLTVCAADVYAVAENGTETLCATLLGTARNIDMNPRPK